MNSTANSTAADFAAIHAVLELYLDGLYHSDTQRLRRVFHPQALYASATEGKPLKEYVEAFERMKLDSLIFQHFQHRLVIFDIGPIAFKKGFEVPDFEFFDLIL